MSSLFNVRHTSSQNTSAKAIYPLYEYLNLLIIWQTKRPPRPIADVDAIGLGPIFIKLNIQISEITARNMNSKSHEYSINCQRLLATNEC